MGKITRYCYWCLFCCLATQSSFCGKIKSIFLERDAYSHEGDEHRFLCEQKSREIEQPQTFFRRNYVVYNKSLFGPSLLDKKECQKSSLKRSPSSNNLFSDSNKSEDVLFSDSNESDKQSSTSQDTSSQETSSSEPSRASTPESSESIVRTAFFHKPRVVAASLTIIIPRVRVAQEDKPVLRAKLVSSFKGLNSPG